MAEIVWRLHLAAAPAAVYERLASDRGRESFWAERSERRGDIVTLTFPNGERLACPIVEEAPPHHLELGYFDGSWVRFDLRAAPGGGTDLTLRETGVRDASAAENRAGWVSVLLALKAAADFGIDLRNHDPARSWDAGFVDN